MCPWVGCAEAREMAAYVLVDQGPAGQGSLFLTVTFPAALRKQRAPSSTRPACLTPALDQRRRASPRLKRRCPIPPRATASRKSGRRRQPRQSRSHQVRKAVASQGDPAIQPLDARPVFADREMTPADLNGPSSRSPPQSSRPVRAKVGARSYEAICHLLLAKSSPNIRPPNAPHTSKSRRFEIPRD